MRASRRGVRERWLGKRSSAAVNSLLGPRLDGRNTRKGGWGALRRAAAHPAMTYLSTALRSDQLEMLHCNILSLPVGEWPGQALTETKASTALRYSGSGQCGSGSRDRPRRSVTGRTTLAARRARRYGGARPAATCSLSVMVMAQEVREFLVIASALRMPWTCFHSALLIVPVPLLTHNAPH